MYRELSVRHATGESGGRARGGLLLPSAASFRLRGVKALRVPAKYDES